MKSQYSIRIIDYYLNFEKCIDLDSDSIESDSDVEEVVEVLQAPSIFNRARGRQASHVSSQEQAKDLNITILPKVQVGENL